MFSHLKLQFVKYFTLIPVIILTTPLVYVNHSWYFHVSWGINWP